MASNKQLEWHRQGMRYAYAYAEKYGLPALKQEIIYRGAHNVPITVTREQIDRAFEEIKLDTFEGCTILFSAVMNDELELSAEDMQRVIDRYTKLISSIATGHASFVDYIETIKEEKDITLAEADKWATKSVD